ncbi:MAG: hypothetical protein ACO1QS_18365, partial [Verrucomicrobiota bacterium]
AVRQLTNTLVLKVGQFFPTRQSNNLLRVEWSSHPKATNQAQRAALWTQAETEIENRRADFQLLHAAMQNPPAEKGADYRNFYSGYPSANFVQRRTIAQLLSHAVTADVHARRLGGATTNMLTLLAMCEHHREEWTLINQMIRVAITGLSLETFHYGLDTQTWTEPELATFQSRIESISLVTNLYQTLLYERALGEVTFAMSRRAPKSPSTYVLDGPVSSGNKIRTLLWANFYIAEDELAFLKFSQSRLEVFRDQMKSSNWASVPEELRTLNEAMFAEADTGLKRLKLWLSSVITMNLAKASETLLKTETRRQQAITAIALERHRLKHGHYPDSLEKLSPAYLTQIPNDPMDGRPLRYRLNQDGTFTLWSIGFDGTDNGGDPTMPDPKKQNFPQDARDFVWPRLDPIDLPPKP